MTDERLRRQAAEFAQEVQDTLSMVLPGTYQIVSLANDARYVVRPDGSGIAGQRIQLFVDDEHLADLGLQFYLSLDRSGTYLKTMKSNFAVHSVLDRTPLIRQEFDAEIRTAPFAHWHVHAERGALTHLLARAHAVRPDLVPKPHDMSALHFPVGGERFRPCLEDFLEFLVRECGVDARSGWSSALAEGRERWRRRQLRAAARDLQHDAADVLRENGWTVSPPEPLPDDKVAGLRKW